MLHHGGIWAAGAPLVLNVGHLWVLRRMLLRLLSRWAGRHKVLLLLLKGISMCLRLLRHQLLWRALMLTLLLRRGVVLLCMLLLRLQLRRTCHVMMLHLRMLLLSTVLLVLLHMLHMMLLLLRRRWLLNML